MDYFSLIVGFVAIVYGVYSYNTKVNNPKKLPAFLQNNRTVRLVFFTITPIALGIIIIAAELIVKYGAK